MRSILIPSSPVRELGIDLNRPITYILRYESFIDLVALEQQCKKIGLPSPLSPLYLAGREQARVTWITPKDSRHAQEHITFFKNLLTLHQQDSDLDVQLVPVSLFWSRCSEVKNQGLIFTLLGRHSPKIFKKFLQVLLLGRRSSLQLSKPVSLRYMADNHGTDERIAHKLSRVARVHFKRLHRAIIGPELPQRSKIISSMMSSEAVIQIIEDEVKSKGITKQEAEKKAYTILNEIAANYTDDMMIFANYILTWVWNKVYSGITIRGTERVRRLAQEGHSIVYVPCHRSHMDYLLVSYILYQEGILPPHIAAGINLNFWPAGPVFRRSGAFFMRRSFSGDKFYASIFRTYLDQLFNKGYSVEFFTEGGRSRTGRLLQPKTGMLAMTTQSFLRGLDRPISLVPVYLGYDHVMEVSTYHRELAGQKKKQESVWHIFSALKRLKNYGQCYVNFGKPITLHKYFNQNFPEFCKAPDITQDQKPAWLTPAVNQLAVDLMARINNAASVTSVSLTSLILLSVKQNSLERSLLEKQLNLSLHLLRHAPLSDDMMVPDFQGVEMLNQVIELGKVECITDDFGEMVVLDEQKVVSMVYYRNNILHLMSLPALLALFLSQKEQLSKEALKQRAVLLFPLFKLEFFIELSEPLDYFERIIQGMIDMEILIEKENKLTVVEAQRTCLQILAGTADESIQRYAILFHVLKSESDMSRPDLEKKCHALAVRLGQLTGVNAPEFFDKKLYSQLALKLKNYLSDDIDQEIHNIAQHLNQLLPDHILQNLLQAQLSS